MPSKRASKQKRRQGEVATPRCTDLLFGRGGHVNHHPGNQRYLELVIQRKDQYNRCKKVDKASVAWDIINDLKAQDPPTRFLRKDYSTGLWHIVPDTEVRRKISQALRERSTPVIHSTKKKSRRNQIVASAPPPVRTTPSRACKQHQAGCDDSMEAEEASEASSVEDDTVEASEPMPPLKGLGHEDDGAGYEDSKLGSGNYATKSYYEQSIPTQGIPMHQGFPMQAYNFQGDDQDEECYDLGPPPRPPPKRMEEANRVWSDYLTASFASFTPSLVDACTGVDNSWENLLDPSSLPQFGAAASPDHPPRNGYSSGSDFYVVYEPEHSPSTTSLKQTSFTATSSLPYADISNVVSQDGTHAGNSTGAQDGGTTEDPRSVDSFFDATNIGKVLAPQNPRDMSDLVKL